MLNQKIKILIVAYACEPNKGSEPGVGWNWAINLSKYINLAVITRKNNREVIEVELNYKNNNLSFIYFDIPILKSLKKYIPFGVQVYYILWQLFFPLIMWKKIKQFHIIHHVTFNSFSMPSLVCLFAKNYIWGPIGGGQTVPINLLYKFRNRAVIELFRTLLVNLNKINPLVLLNYYYAKRILVANSITERRLLKTKKSIKLLETGINSKYLIRSDFSKIQKKSVQILWIGSKEPHKAFFFLLDALSIVSIEIDVKVIGIDNEISKYRINKFKNHNISIDFIKYIDHAKILNYYKKADIFVFTSLRDTSGNVVLEAMSQGLPIIAFDHHGMHDILTEECAIKIPISNYNKMVEDIAHSIDKLANDRELRIKMGKASIQRIMDNYLWEDKAKRIVEIYKEVLNENPPSS